MPEHAIATREEWQAARAELAKLETEQAERNDQLVRLAVALETLPDEQREAVELHYWQGWTLAQIATHQDRSPASVAGLVHRGLARLRKSLGE